MGENIANEWMRFYFIHKPKLIFLKINVYIMYIYYAYIIINDRNFVIREHMNEKTENWR